MSDHSAASSDQDAPTAAATAPVTVEQAAAILGVSVTTVKRRIRAGALRAEEARRPQGTVWLVYLPLAADPAATSGRAPTGTAATAPTTTPAADAMVGLIQTTIATVLGPLVGQLDALRLTVERQADRVAELERENGRFAAERAAAEARYAALEARTASQNAEASTNTVPDRMHVLAPWALGLLAAIAVVVALTLAPSWVR